MIEEEKITYTFVKVLWQQGFINLYREMTFLAHLSRNLTVSVIIKLVSPMIQILRKMMDSAVWFK